jgi:hypothetical protein
LVRLAILISYLGFNTPAAPAWTTAGIYVVLFRMIPIVGRQASPFLPKTCLLICLGVDIISLSLQAVGGGLAGQAFTSDVDTAPGTYTMVAGILFQLVSTLAYTVLMSIVFFRAAQYIKASRPLCWLAATMCLTIACMITRNVYRAIELLQGWSGTLNRTEVYIIALDGSLMAFAIIALNIFNPARLLALARKESVEQRPPMKEFGSEELQRRSSDDSLAEC